jgi:hypothetical protein
MLLWMICSGELIPYFLKGKSIAKCPALAALLQGVGDGKSIDEARTTVRSFTAELAEKILAAKVGGAAKSG